jgi:hypothetical protein
MKDTPVLFFIPLNMIYTTTSCFSTKSNTCVTWSKTLSNSLIIGDRPIGLTHDLNPDSFKFPTLKPITLDPYRRTPVNMKVIPVLVFIHKTRSTRGRCPNPDLMPFLWTKMTEFSLVNSTQSWTCETTDFDSNYVDDFHTWGSHTRKSQASLFFTLWPVTDGFVVKPVKVCVLITQHVFLCVLEKKSLLWLVHWTINRELNKDLCMSVGVMLFIMNR